MKRCSLLTSALVLAGMMTATAEVTLRFTQFPPQVGEAFSGFSDSTTSSGSNGLAWGIVAYIGAIETFTDFSGLDNLPHTSLADGIDTSGQVFGNSNEFVYLTGTIPSESSGIGYESVITRTSGLGPYQGLISEIIGIKYTNTSHETDPDKQYTLETNNPFALIWFENDEITWGNKYGYFHVDGFTLPQDDTIRAYSHLANAAGDRTASQTFQAIPEPATYAVLLAGLALGYGVVRRRTAAAIKP